MDERAEATGVDRFWERVLVVGSGCWLWDGYVNPTNGYGQFTVRVNGANRTITAHRLAYELFIGPVADGLEIDHLCRVRSCVRPDHLEAVTHSTNVLRGVAPLRTTLAAVAQTHCGSGHPLSGDNLYVHTDSRGYSRRICRTCRDARKREWDRRSRSAA